MMKFNKYIVLLFLGFTSFFYAQEKSKVVKVWRTTNNINEQISFSVNPFTVEANTTKYIHIDIYYDAEPDIAITVDADATNEDGVNIIRPLTSYSNLGQWQTIVFPIEASVTAINVSKIIIYPDRGEQNSTTNMVLNANTYGFLDNILLKNTSTLSTTNTDLDTSIALYPNPTNGALNVNTSNNIIKVLFYNSIGKNITQNTILINSKEYDIRNLAPGIYFAKIFLENGSINTKRFLKL